MVRETHLLVTSAEQNNKRASSG